MKKLTHIKHIWGTMFLAALVAMGTTPIQTQAEPGGEAKIVQQGAPAQMTAPASDLNHGALGTFAETSAPQKITATAKTFEAQLTLAAPQTRTTMGATIRITADTTLGVGTQLTAISAIEDQITVAGFANKRITHAEQVTVGTIEQAAVISQVVKCVIGAPEHVAAVAHQNIAAQCATVVPDHHQRTASVLVHFVDANALGLTSFVT